MDVERAGVGNAGRNSADITMTNIRPLNYLPPKRITTQNAVKRSPGFNRTTTVLEDIIATVKNVGRR
jgi:hypothetical protein